MLPADFVLPTGSISLYTYPILDDNSSDNKKDQTKTNNTIYPKIIINNNVYKR